MINHENFDMYCMRCADGDLSPSELKALHAYVASHPELKGEWEIWQQLKIPADTTTRPSKEQLFRKEQAQLEEEQAWLLIDGELTANEQIATEELIAGNEAASQLVNHLRQFVLIPQTVDCPDKHLLLRSTQQPRVIWMQRVVRFTAAAAIVALLLQVAITKRSNNAIPASTSVVTKGPTTKPVAEPTTIGNTTTRPSSSLPDNDPVITGGITSIVSNETGREDVNKKITSPTVIENSPSIPPTPSPTQPTPPIIASNSPNTTEPTVSKPNPPIDNIGTIASATSDDDRQTTKPLAQQVIYRELDTESERTTITVGSVEMREGKVRGVWRKLGAILRSPAQRNNTGDNSSIATQQPL